MRTRILWNDLKGSPLLAVTTWLFMAEFTRLNREDTTILMVTHDSKAAARCGRILYLLDGCIKGEFSPAGVVGEKEQIKSMCVWAVVCLAAMIIGPIGTSLLPKTVFSLFERFSTFSAVIFNVVLGIYLIKGRFTDERIYHITKKEQEGSK